LLAGSALLLGAAAGYFSHIPQRLTALAVGAILSMLVDTMIPEAFQETHDYAGLITVAGFLIAFALSKVAGG
jgi:ZIP family zinc transporter